jgi:CRP/FNR family transcriptional regulator, dissimilatory nitrate respiration regulator
MPRSPQLLDIGSLLARAPLFAGMKNKELAHLASGTKEIEAARGDVLFRKEQACTGLYLLIEGQVKLFFASPEGHEKIFDIATPGQTFGESALFQGTRQQVCAQTLSYCRLLHIDKTAIMDRIGKSPAFARRVIERLAQRLFDLTQDVESYSLDSGRQRVINYLVREALGVARTHGQNTLTLTLPTSKGAIASRLSLTQEHFSRLLHELSTDELLSIEGRDVHIKDLARLRQYTGRSGPAHALLPLASVSPAGKRRISRTEPQHASAPMLVG